MALFWHSKLQNTNKMKMTFRSLILLFSLIAISSIAKSQETNEFITRLKTQLFYYQVQNIIQTVAIQTDKSLYRPGEVLWVKAYVTDAVTHKLSLKSQELIVHLIDHKGNVINSANFSLKNGTGTGFLSISPDAGNDLYSLMAWTPEMANGSVNKIAVKDIYVCTPEKLDLVPQIEYSDALLSPDNKVTAIINLKDFSGKPLTGKKFDFQVMSGGKELVSGKGKTAVDGNGEITFKTPASYSGKPLILNADISAGDEKINFTSHIPLSSEKIDVSFFPEGGRIVAGIPQRIVFKAKDQLGNPVNVDAEIINDKGEILAKATSIHIGLGLFNMINPENSGYKFRINSTLGKGQETALPSADLNGMSISVIKNDGQNMDLLLTRSPKSMHSKFLAITLKNGEINWASEFELEQIGIIKVPLDNFESEIGAVTIFDQNGTLAGQRLVYTGKKNTVEVLVNPDKSIYSRSGEGNIKVKLAGPDGNPVKGELTASISENHVCLRNDDISDGLNFGLEDPILTDIPLNQGNKMILDYFLIANHLKGFDWDKILAIDPLNPKAMKSDEQEISVKAVDFEVKPVLKNPFIDQVAHLRNHIDRINEWNFLETFQRQGYFGENPDFLKPIPSDSTQAGDNKNKVPGWKICLENGGTILDAINMVHPYLHTSENQNPWGLIIFRGFNTTNEGYPHMDGALIVIDGVKMGINRDVLAFVDPGNVEDIKVLLNPDEITKYTGFNSNGVIDITTKRGGLSFKSGTAEEFNQNAMSTGSFKPIPIGNKKYNLLTTLQWIPDLSTDEKGEAWIKFTAGNVKSTFSLNIIGHTDKGEWFDKQVELSVR
jgi:hypothetical protein